MFQHLNKFRIIEVKPVTKRQYGHTRNWAYMISNTVVSFIEVIQGLIMGFPSIDKHESCDIMSYDVQYSICLVQNKYNLDKAANEPSSDTSKNKWQLCLHRPMLANTLVPVWW